MLNIRAIVDTFIANLETSIRETIMSSLGTNGTYGKPSNGHVPSVERGVNKPRKITKARKSQMKLQGQYLGSLKALSKKNQSAVKAEQKKNGLVSAISLAGRLKAEKTNKRDK